MPNLVRDWMSSPIIVIDPDSSVSHAMTLMRRRKINSVVVDISEKNPAYGIITTTDIRDKIVAEGRNPAETTVRDIMSGQIITGRAEWTLMECSKIMQKHKFHHLPIADASGTLIGMISATDIFMAVEEQGWIEEN
ncbi:MAG: signal-transduction protein [Chloroflexi bacterium OLB14]|nr:MAG: signal-transduction protein [Chloroflexi bacterium OLB14]